jgi:hypothetical protein
VQQFSGNISVTMGLYPIFTVIKRPKYKVLASFYFQFIEYNCVKKLKYQYEKCKNDPSVRAHFTTELLKCYGISASKIYKLCNSKDRGQFPRDFSKSDQCGVMIQDSINRLWVWDPWGFYGKFNYRLLTLKEWLTSESKPGQILIDNGAVFYPNDNRVSSITNFHRLFDSSTIDKFQAICGEALPSRPEYPLTINLLNNYRLFKYKETKMKLKSAREKMCLLTWKNQ